MKRQSVVGLTSEEVAHSRALHGENVFVKEKRKSIVRKFLENLKDPIIEILLAALVLEVVFTFGHCNLFEVFGIVAAILIATGVTTFSEHASAMAFEKLNADNSTKLSSSITAFTLARISLPSCAIFAFLSCSN